jgi:hypothetical protein
MGLSTAPARGLPDMPREDILRLLGSRPNFRKTVVVIFLLRKGSLVVINVNSIVNVLVFFLVGTFEGDDEYCLDCRVSPWVEVNLVSVASVWVVSKRRCALCRLSFVAVL